jgi:peptidylprolyl isomerase
LKRILSMAPLVLLFLLAAQPVFAQTGNKAVGKGKSRPAQSAGAEAELKRLERAWFDALVKGDSETLNRILADDFTALNSDGGFIDKAKMIEASQAGRARLDEIKSDEFKLRLYGNTAVVTGGASYIHNQKLLRQDSHIEVWVKRTAAGKPRWQVVSWVSMPVLASILGAKAVTTESGLQYEDIVVGNGPSPQSGQQVTVHYTGTLENGNKFDSSLDRGQPFNFTIGVGQVIKGWDEGVMTMKIGGKRKLVIPPQLGYGARGVGPIPPNATLVFEVQLLDVK